MPGTRQGLVGIQGYDEVTSDYADVSLSSGVTKVTEASDVITVTPTVSASAAYTAGDAVGGKQTLTGACRVSGGKALLKSINVRDAGNQKAALTLLFFNANPTAATITDNAAFVFSTDFTKCVGKVNIAGADYETVDSKAVASKVGIDLMMEASGSAIPYVAVVTTGTPTYAATSDLSFDYGFQH